MSNFKFPISNFKLWWLLIPAVLLRVFLALSTFHPDIRAFNLAGELIGSGNILSLYDYLASCSVDNPLVRTFGADLFIYPPLVYLLHGVFNFIFSVIFGKEVVNGFMIEQVSYFGNWLFNLHLLLLKVPYFFFDLPAVWAVTGLFDRKRDQLFAACLWLFNPVILYSAYMMGQFDVIPAVLTIWSLWCIRRKKLYFAALLLGLAAAFKLYPLFLIVPFIVIGKNWQEKFSLGFLAVFPYLLSVIPFLPSPGFRTYALMAGLTQKTLYAQIPVSGGESLLLFPLLLLVLYFYFWFFDRTVERIWQRWLVVLLSFFIFTHFHPQWLSWLVPFLVIEVVSFRFKTVLLQLFLALSFIGMVFLFDPSLTVKIFAPLFPSLFSLPGTWQEMGVRIDEVYIRSMLQTIFASAGVFYIYMYLANKLPENTE